MSQTPLSPPAPLSRPLYWKSLDERRQDPDFVAQSHREFPQGASELEDVSRRDFLKWMGASLGLAGLGLSGCWRRPEAKVMPYGTEPERIIPGVALYYASSFSLGLEGIPVLVETHEGRPTKLEGNPSYKAYGGSTSRYAQASVLDLYDPHRGQKSRHEETALDPESVRKLIADLRKKLQSNQGSGMALLAEPSSSPSRHRIYEALRKEFPQIQFYEHSPIPLDGAEKVYSKTLGQRLRPDYQFQNAKRILSLDGDFLGSMAGQLGYTRAFHQGRKLEGADDAEKMNRLYMVEANFSLTGSSADHRLRLETSQMAAFSALLAAEIFEQSAIYTEQAASLKEQAKGLKVDTRWLKEAAKDLVDHAGASLVVAGPHLPESVHILALAMNSALKAPGKTLLYRQVAETFNPGLAELVDEIEAKKINSLLIFGGNPVYDAPIDLSWPVAQQKVPLVVRWGYYDDETAQKAHYYLAGTHSLENWGDARAWDGSWMPVQPTIHPIFEGISELEVLLGLLGQTDKGAYAWTRETFEQKSPTWGYDRFLAEGILPDSAYPITEPKIQPDWLQEQIAGKDFKPKNLDLEHLEVRLVPSYPVWDGRFANNGWLQECPDPITKLTWDNAILVSPLVAQALEILPEPGLMSHLGQSAIRENQFQKGREIAQLGEVNLGGIRVIGPIHIQPGLADYTLVLPLGYGRTEGGPLAHGTGFSAYPLQTQKELACRLGAALTVLDQTYPLANTQEHWSMEGRDIIREANSDEYTQNPDFATEMGLEVHSPVYGKDQHMPLKDKATQIPRGNSMYQTPAFSGPQQWGMVIDLNSCTGCNACVVACQAENNVPIVGKEQVLRGREMHWIRIDRYYSSAWDLEGKPDKRQLPVDPQVNFQPIMCQHCELAPCENVCPVAATVHDEQGLNVMAYQRCVGTRYCANNCPWKVRRFNFFDWNKRQIGHFYEGPLGPSGPEDLTKMQKNPNVTVRMRGVMEKCSLCIQRIEKAKQNQKIIARDSDNILVPDGVIRTACQQVCPSEAITFGDVADPQTKVSRLKGNSRNYSVLGYLNTRPRVTYLAKVRNPNPKMPDYHKLPLGRLEYELRYGHSAGGEEHPADDPSSQHAPHTT